MIKILANDGLHEDGQTLMEEAGYEVHTEKIPQEALPERLPDFDVVIVRSATKIDRALIERCPKLKIIARGGIGLDNIDVEYARQKGITVMHTPAASSLSVAELTFAHIFALSRSVHLANREMPQLGREQFKELKRAYAGGIQLRGKTLGVVGFGRIGREVSRIGIALGMKVLPVDLVIEEAHLDLNVFNSENVSLSVKLQTAEWEDVLAQSDYLTLHVPYTGGRPFIGKEEIQKMKKGVLLLTFPGEGLSTNKPSWMA